MKNRGYALKKIAFAAPAVVLFALSGCSTRTLALGREQSGCDLSVNTVCARAIDSYLADEALQPVQVASSKGPHLVPIVAPVTLPGGELAAEVDCYVDVHPNGSWLVYAHVAIPPRSMQAIEHLRNQALCTEQRPERRLVMEIDAIQALSAGTLVGHACLR